MLIQSCFSSPMDLCRSGNWPLRLVTLNRCIGLPLEGIPLVCVLLEVGTEHIQRRTTLGRMRSYASGWTFKGRSCSVPSTLVCVAYHPVFSVSVPTCLVQSTGWRGQSMRSSHTWGTGMPWWTQSRVLSGWPPLTCSKLRSCNHDTGRVYVIP